jgi:aryl-alcohol dehydrogenase-like predicted oxidoreductase
MARSEGLALAPWGVLGGGKIRTNAEEARRKETGEKGRLSFGPNWERTPEEKKVCDVLEEIAKEVNTESITAGMSWFRTLISVFELARTKFACSRYCVPPA